MLSRVFDEWCKHSRINNVPGVILVFESWCTDEMAKKHDGPNYVVEFFEPQPKDSYTWICLKASSVGGLHHSLSWSVTRNDFRNKDLRGKGKTKQPVLGVILARQVHTPKLLQVGKSISEMSS